MAPWKINSDFCSLQRIKIKESHHNRPTTDAPFMKQSYTYHFHDYEAIQRKAVHKLLIILFYIFLVTGALFASSSSDFSCYSH